MRFQRNFTTRKIIGSLVVAAAVVGTAGVAVASGVLGSSAESPNVPRVVTNSLGWQAVADGSSGTLKQVGWIDPNRPAVRVNVRNASQVGQTVAVGYQLVLDDAGRPIGLLGPSGFRRGGVEVDGSLTPSVRESLEATAEVRSSEGAPPRRP